MFMRNAFSRAQAHWITPTVATLVGPVPAATAPTEDNAPVV